MYKLHNIIKFKAIKHNSTVLCVFNSQDGYFVYLTIYREHMLSTVSRPTVEYMLSTMVEESISEQLLNLYAH